MTQQERVAWLAGLKVGDVLIVENHGKAHDFTITHFSPKRIHGKSPTLLPWLKLSFDRVNWTGTYGVLMQNTQQVRDTITHNAFAGIVKSAVNGSLSTDQLTRILAIVKEGKEIT